MPEEINKQELSDPETVMLSNLEATIEDGLGSFLEVGAALEKIRGGRLYRNSHETFEAYCSARWDFTRRRADMLISATRTVNALPSTVMPPTRERHVRELAKLPDEQQAAAWEKVIENAPVTPDGRPNVTTAAVATAVKDVMKGSEPAKAGARVAKKDKKMRDALKHVVPVPLVPHWCQARLLKGLVNDLGSILNQAKEIAKGDGGEFLNVEEVERHLKNAQSQLSFGAFYTRCPDCTSSGPDFDEAAFDDRPSCDTCFSAGFIVKGVFQRLSDQQKSRLADDE